MTKEEFKILVKGMKAVYTQATFLPDPDAFNIWYEMLKDLPYQLAETAIHKHMLTEKFPPTIADIRSEVAEIIAPDELRMNEAEAWAVVYEACKVTIYHAGDAFDKLPEACQKAIGSSGNLYQLAKTLNDANYSVMQSNFFREYRDAVKEIKRDSLIIPQQARELIDTIRHPALSESDPEDCTHLISAFRLESLEIDFDYNTLDEHDRLQVESGLAGLCELYTVHEYDPSVYITEYINTLGFNAFNDINYYYFAISNVHKVARAYLKYKKSKNWRVQELGVFLAEFKRHERECRDGEYKVYARTGTSSDTVQKLIDNIEKISLKRSG